MAEPEEKHEPLRITVGPKSDMTPAPAGDTEQPTELTATQRGTQGILERFKPGDLPHITDDEKGQAAFEQLLPGQRFTDAKGDKFTKPYTVSDDSDFEKVPEGATFVDSEGNRFTKPKFQAISPTAQMLYEMAQTPDAKEQALKTIYGDKVKKYPSGDLYVDDDGTPRKPGARDVGTFAATTAAATAPAVGMGVGSVGGSAGVMAGAATGRQFNNTILSLFGVRQSAGEQVSSSAWEAAGAGLGETAGKAISAVPKAAKNAYDFVSKSGGKVLGNVGNIAGGTAGDVLDQLGISPETMRGFLGLSKEDAQRASGIAGRLKSEIDPVTGKETNRFKSPLGPEVMAPEAPMLHKIAQFDRLFRTQNVIKEGAEAFADQEAKRVLEDEAIGVKLTEPLSKSTKQVSSREAGQLLLNAAQRDFAHDAAQLDFIIRESTSNIERRIGETQATAGQRLSQLQQAHQQAISSAERMIRAQAEQLRLDTEVATRLASHGEDPSAINRMVAGQYDAFDTGIRAQARQMYDAARAVTQGAPFPNTTRLASHAEAFLRSMPESLRSRYPSEIADLARLVDRDVEIPGISRSPTLNQGEPQQSLDWAGLHHMRSWLRHGIDYNDMTPDMRQGALKHFEREVNNVLHDPNAPPQLRQATALLDQADAFYRDNIPFLNDHMVKSVMSALESGAGVDAKEVARLLFDPSRTAALRRARGIIGENGWRAVEAAHVQNMLAQSQTHIPGQYDFSRFSSQVLDQVRSGIIDTAYSPGMASRLRQLATRMGQFDGSIPLSVGENDTLASIMRQGAATKAAIDEAAATDPIRMLQEDLAKVNQEHAQAVKQMGKEVQNDPLGFLYKQNMSQMAVKAAEKILDSPDLLQLAAQRFNPDSPEFNALRKVAVQRFFQRPFETLGTLRTELATKEKGMSEETQALLFPGVTKNMMVEFARDMEFLFKGPPTDVGGGIAGGTRVLNPKAHLPFPLPGNLSQFVFGIPGINFVSRITLGKYFAMIMDAVSHPNFAHWLAENLKGSPEQRELARQVVQQRLKMGGLFGAAAGQKELGGPAGQYMEQPEPAIAPEQHSSLPQGEVLSDEGPDPVRPGAQYAMMDDKRNPFAGRPDAGGAAGPMERPTERIDFKSAGAKRGTPTGASRVETPRPKSISELSPDERKEWEKKAAAEMEAHLAKMAKTKEGRKIIRDLAKEIEADGGERLDYKSAGAKK